MYTESWWEIASVFLLSTAKFVFGGVPLALVYGFSFFKAVAVTSLGGFTGVLFFVMLSEFILKKIRDAKQKKDLSKPQTNKKIFSRKKRLIIHVKRRFGLIGIAFLTPLLFSIPLGCFLAMRYFKNRHQVIIYMFVSILFWSVSISSFKLLF